MNKKENRIKEEIYNKIVKLEEQITFKQARRDRLILKECERLGIKFPEFEVLFIKKSNIEEER